jgi:hydrogenase maturation protein HypF
VSAGDRGCRLRVRGIVQGVGFRPWVHRLAHEAGLRGRVWNDAEGVVIEAFGPPDSLARLRRRLSSGAPAAGRVTEVEAVALPDEACEGFVILASGGDAQRRVSIPADLATCEACRREVADPADRRHGYAFTNCTACGPRWSVALDVPYDRATTTLAPFPLCPACRREYEDPADRRFHAEATACPDCGPRLAFIDARGRTQPVADPLAEAARAILAGRVVAVRGLGGFHLACDATSSEAVKRLRERKRRAAKPFAVMVADRDAAARLARVDDGAARALGSPEAPVVLLPARPESGIAPEVAPGLPVLGLLLPYTPLHHRLAREVGRPLVLTSGNLSDEPIATGNREALDRLGGVADAFLVHDREIAGPCDDSVVAWADGAPVVLRRARGFVPRPVRVARPFPEALLACGGHLKNAVCLGVGELAFLGPHVGDLETPEALDALRAAVERLERFVGVRAEVVAHDLHPDYASTRYALERGARRAFGVQHHHAHVASALAEHGVAGPALGLAWDGTGFGDDGGAWGGELLRVEGAALERLATFRPVRLAGGERAIREPWRQALAVLHDAFDGRPPLASLALFERVPRERLAAVRGLLDADAHTLAAHGVGRWFDAIGALVLGRCRSRYEGEVALAWNGVAEPGRHETYPFAIETAGEGGVARADLRPLVRAVVADLADGVSAARISGRFHETLAAIASALVARAPAACRELPVVLTGGCFGNPLLLERTRARLGRGRRVLRHREVPPGDGGLALGQAVVAAARLAAEEGGSASCV